MIEWGLERVKNLWCIFKVKNNKTYWIDSKKEWNIDKTQRAGTQNYKKAMEFLEKEIKKDV